MKLKPNLKRFIGTLKKLCIVLSTLIFASILTACNSLQEPLKIQLPPANLTTLCSDLDAPLSGQSRDVLVWSLQTIEAYKICQARHKGLVEAWPR